MGVLSGLGLLPDLGLKLHPSLYDLRALLFRVPQTSDREPSLRSWARAESALLLTSHEAQDRG